MVNEAQAVQTVAPIKIFKTYSRFPGDSGTDGKFWILAHKVSLASFAWSSTFPLTSSSRIPRSEWFTTLLPILDVSETPLLRKGLICRLWARIQQLLKSLHGTVSYPSECSFIYRQGTGIGRSTGVPPLLEFPSAARAVAVLHR